MNYEDPRIQKLEEEKMNKLNDNNSLYDNMINDNQKMLDEQNSWQDAYLQQQNELFDRSTGLITDKLNQNKKELDESYQKEALASESSYQDFINPYGVQAEQQASTRLNNSGYSESTKSTAYGAARIRTALARSAAIKANTEYDNQIKEAQLSNDSQKANLALEILKEKLANRLNAFQTDMNIKQNKLNFQTDTDNTYYNRYQDVFNQQNYEKERAEEMRRYQEQLAYQKEQDKTSQQNWQKEYNLAVNKTKDNDGITLDDQKFDDDLIDLLERAERSKSSFGATTGTTLQKNIIAKELEKGNITKAEAIKLAEYYKL